MNSLTDSMADRAHFLSRIVVPIAWERLAQAPTPEAHAALQSANDGVLSFLLRDVESEATQRVPDERMAEALAPVHAKLDMVIELLGRLRYRDIDLPPPREIEFALDRLGWLSPQALTPGDWLRFRLYFHPTFLEPVLLHGRVSGCAPDSDGNYRTEADLAAMSEANDAALARLAFLAQRRQLAHRPATHAAHATHSTR
ncbi:MAG TPA: hypothetical protein VHY35_04595 [Stellaceae bacterium]|nr:hypothetical protein [Stellaceae bacterium]